jgi:thiol:disulfide interchange protein
LFEFLETSLPSAGANPPNYMKKFLSLLFALLLVNAAFAQILIPAKWASKPSKKEVKIGETIELIFEASIIKDWYLYSTDFDPDCGPIVTTFTFEPHASYETVGDIVPVNPIKKMDEVFGCEVSIFKGKGTFKQKIRVKSADLRIYGNYDYQVCSDIDGKCIPFDEDFAFDDFKVLNVGGSAPKQENNKEEPSASLPPEESQASQEEGAVSPEDVELAGEQKLIEAEEFSTEIGDPAGLGLWAFLLLAFTTGLAALITPCVFPMIPMTVTFFLKDAGTRAMGIRNGLVFGVSIIGIYTLLGTLFAMILGAEGLNAMATHWLPNLFIFVVFFFFALAFLGMFELVLPASWVNKVDRKADQGGLIGIFFMAFALALVSFSCTVPIVGSVLILSAGGEILKPILGMLSFSLAFAIPFTLFAIFPEWLKSLPKSGGWLNSVKVVLGFLELALGLKFLSVADQAYHWGLLDREIYLGFWIVIFTMMAFYLIGKIRLPHDSKMEAISVPRLIMSIGVFTFVLYLVPGMFGAPLKALAGYLPPMSTHDFDVPGLLRESATGTQAEATLLCDPVPRHSDRLKFPHGIRGYFDYQEALSCAKEQGKPLFIDFTGHGCVNCREMEARVWADPAVLERMRERFVMVALYVDDKKELSKEEWITSTYDGKVKKSIGKQNADFQITRFNNNAQPYYIILDPHTEKLLAPPKAYDLEVKNFVDFLDGALGRYKAKK